MANQCVLNVSTAQSFAATAVGLPGMPAGTAMVAFRLQPGSSDRPPSGLFAEALHALANLAVATPMISLCHLEGPCTGAALAIALRCDVLTMTPRASLSIAWDDPGAAAVHAGGAERVGVAACEKALFDRTCGAAEATDRGLASFLCDDFEAALDRTSARVRTIHATARAARLAWPFPKAAAIALAEPFASAC